MRSPIVTTPLRHRLRGSKVASSMLAGVLVALLSGLIAGWMAGWRLHEMTTPSMGTIASVGTLVISEPVTFSQVHVGQVIAFHPPGRSNVTFVHRVVEVIDERTGHVLRTKGDINGGPDPWLLHQSDLVGGVVVTVPDAGFLIEAIPLFLVGVFGILLMTSGLRRRSRTPVRIGAGSVLVAALLIYFRPLERIVLLRQFVSSSHGYASVVPTGILPIRVHALGGNFVNLSPGQQGSLRVAHVRDNGAFRITSAVHLTGWWWLILAVWAVPIVVGLASRRDTDAKPSTALRFPRESGHPTCRLDETAGRMSPWQSQEGSSPSSTKPRQRIESSTRTERSGRSPESSRYSRAPSAPGCATSGAGSRPYLAPATSR